MRNTRAGVRIVHCADYGGPYAGSFIPVLSAAARAARDVGYETTMCFSERARDRPWLAEVTPLADIRFIERSGIRGDLRQLKQILDEGNGRPTLLHTHFGTFDETAALLGLHRRSTAVVWHWHSENPRRIKLRSKAYGAVFGRIVNAILCVSQDIYQGALARSVPPAKLRQFPNAIDLERFGPMHPEERDSARRALGLSPSCRVVLHLGWDWQRKGGDLLLEAADLMSSEHDLAVLTVAGEGLDGPPVEKLERHPIVKPLAPRGNVNELYAAADVFVSASRAEGMPYALLEALARGLSVVATDLPAQREVLHGLPGARVVPPDPEALARALRQGLALTPAQRAEHADAARARVAASYALEPWSRRLVALYAEALT